MKMVIKDKNGNVLRTLEIKKAAKLNMEAQRLYVEPLSGGGCRLAFTSGIVEDWRLVDTIQMVRD